MRNIIALSLAAIIFVAALAGCAPASANTAAISPRIRVTSSDAADAAAWLTARLDTVPDSVVIGTDASSFGVDVAALEDDGYIIRTLDGEVALFARTAEGLDRAVRKYAKAVEAGERVEDETYHEGYRIKDLRLAGVPIAEYAVAVEGESEYFRNWVTSVAADALIKLVKIACGAELSVGGDAEHKIIFRQIADDTFKESSYHYYFADGNLIFEYTNLAGARNAAVKFLENECGWDDLYYGFDLLHEADLVDVPAECDVLCHPRFGGFRHTTMGSFSSSALYRVNAAAFTYKYRVDSAHHWLGSVWGKEYGYSRTGTLPCLTDDYVLEDIAAEMSASAAATVAAGGVIGEDFVFFNIGMEDAGDWCYCKECSKLYRSEGYTHAGEMVYFANRLDAAMDEFGYDGLKYSMFAYYGSNIPPKTLVPGDDVYVTFVFDGSCTNHCLDTSQCETMSNPDGVKNKMGDWLRGWCDIAPHVYARPAPLILPMHPVALIDQTYDDIVFFTEIGVECIYDEIYSCREFDTNLIVSELWDAMMFDPDMTRTEYREEVARLFEKYYGDGWQGVLDYVDCLERAEMENRRCWTAWHSYLLLTAPEQFDHPTYRAYFDRMVDSLAEARRGANSREQEIRVEKQLIVAIINGCYASYYNAYNEYDDDTIAKLDALWAEMIEISKDIGVYDNLKRGSVSPYGSGLYEGYPKGELIFDTLEETAWIGAWRAINDNYRMILSIYGADHVRPIPEEYRQSAD